MMIKDFPLEGKDRMKYKDWLKSIPLVMLGGYSPVLNIIGADADLFARMVYGVFPESWSKFTTVLGDVNRPVAPGLPHALLVYDDFGKMDMDNQNGPFDSLLKINNTDYKECAPMVAVRGCAENAFSSDPRFRDESWVFNVRIKKHNAVVVKLPVGKMGVGLSKIIDAIDTSVQVDTGIIEEILGLFPFSCSADRAGYRSGLISMYSCAKGDRVPLLNVMCEDEGG